MHTATPDEGLDSNALRAALIELRKQLDEAERVSAPELGKVHAEYRESARNLLQYLVARQLDLRPFQLELRRRGLSSLGRLEGHVHDALDQVIARLEESMGHARTAETISASSLSAGDGDQLLRAHTVALFGPKPAGRHVYVMVTAPEAAEVSEAWVSRLLDAGMNVLRINAAHEGPVQWQAIASTARSAAAARGLALRILVDLPGPKLRTVAPHLGPRVVRWKPERDLFGRVTAPVRVALIPKRARTSTKTEPYLEVPDALWQSLVLGDVLEFRDARGRKRCLHVSAHSERETFATLERTAYVVPETTVALRRAGTPAREFQKDLVEPRPFELELAVGDRFRLRDLTQSSPPSNDLPLIGCSLREPLSVLELGSRVLFDDGKLSCIVEIKEPGGVVLRVLRASKSKFKLCAERGINFPDTTLPGPALGADDAVALDFAISHADIVGASFVRGPEDVRELHSRLEALGASKLGVILKIETTTAFAALPAILLAAMTRFPTGVMIARGDLAVEAGFERLAELQEEILWLCEAAHLPAIWATQVLDQMARTGTATRAEVTDAAMSGRAECVMLNKGPFVSEAVVALIDILRRMEAHQYKKRSLFRKLHFRLPIMP